MARDTAEGFVHDKYAAVRAAFEANLASGADVGASFCATKDGETVVDLWGGWADEAKTRPWEQDTIVNVDGVLIGGPHETGRHRPDHQDADRTEVE